ncbi:serine protease 27 [Anabrus simplex]|uniref:serine protease 27 n=1 Tax=Anabrus simplex TaxID=316456 RepID=UPI0034DD4B79
MTLGRAALTFMAILHLSSAATLAANKHGARLLPSLLGYPTQCRHNDAPYRCTLTFTCWLVGGTLTRGCSRGGAMDFVADLLFTCCVPAQQPTHHPITLPVPVPVPAPIRREDIDHRRTEILDQDHRIECGVPRMGIQKRIIGGDEALFGEFPWQAHLRISGYQCGGVLLSRWFVATAAHCIHRARAADITVLLGEHDTHDTGAVQEPYPAESYAVRRKIVHPAFQFRATQPDRFDVALLRLARPVAFRDHILPICLPRAGAAFKGRMGVVAGWGKTDTAYGKSGTNILHKAAVPILNDQECLQWHQHKMIRLELFSEMFCAGHSDGRMDACLGDSGGPLIVFSEGRWTLAGITSAGFGCGVDHQPGIYHKVSDTAKWIASHINAR